MSRLRSSPKPGDQISAASGEPPAESGIDALRIGASSAVRAFDAYAMIDWSSSARPVTGEDSIWIASGAWSGRRLEMETTYYLGRKTLLPNGPAKLPAWRKRLFIVMAKNAQTASAFFGLPPNRIVEMGAQIQL